jgi:NADH:ubiquinone reductase (non-electrogenic)
MLRPRLPVAARLIAHRALPQPVRIATRRFQSTAAELPKTPPPPRKRGAIRSLFVYTYRFIFISTLAGAAFFGYSSVPGCHADTSVDAYLSRHPPEGQLPADGKRKTLVILGSGWGSTSILKGLDTEGYQVVVVSPRNYFLFTRLPTCLFS